MRRPHFPRPPCIPQPRPLVHVPERSLACSGCHRAYPKFQPPAAQAKPPIAWPSRPVNGCLRASTGIVDLVASISANCPHCQPVQLMSSTFPKSPSRQRCKRTPSPTCSSNAVHVPYVSFSCPFSLYFWIMFLQKAGQAASPRVQFSALPSNLPFDEGVNIYQRNGRLVRLLILRTGPADQTLTVLYVFCVEACFPGWKPASANPLSHRLPMPLSIVIQPSTITRQLRGNQNSIVSPINRLPQHRVFAWRVSDIVEGTVNIAYICLNGSSSSIKRPGGGTTALISLAKTTYSPISSISILLATKLAIQLHSALPILPVPLHAVDAVVW